MWTRDTSRNLEHSEVRPTALMRVGALRHLLFLLVLGVFPCSLFFLLVCRSFFSSFCRCSAVASPLPPFLSSLLPPHASV